MVPKCIYCGHAGNGLMTPGQKVWMCVNRMTCWIRSKRTWRDR